MTLLLVVVVAVADVFGGKFAGVEFDGSGGPFVEVRGGEGCVLSSFKLVLEVFKDDLKGTLVTGEEIEGDEAELEVGGGTDASPSVSAEVVVNCVA